MRSLNLTEQNIKPILESPKKLTKTFLNIAVTNDAVANIKCGRTNFSVCRHVEPSNDRCRFGSILHFSSTKRKRNNNIMKLCRLMIVRHHILHTV